MSNKNTYHARVQNQSGAGEYAGNGSNLSQLKSQIRAKYGAGWTAIITKVEHGGQDRFAPEEVARFTLRK